MGTKSGTKRHAGARGSRQPLAHPDVVAQTQSALAALEQGDDDEALEYARGKRMAAVRKLVSLMNSPKASKSVQRQAARDVLEYADRAKIGQVPSDGGLGGGGGGGLTVNIYNLSQGEVESRKIEREVAEKEVEGVARQIQEVTQNVGDGPMEADVQEPEPLTLEPSFAPASDGG